MGRLSVLLQIILGNIAGPTTSELLPVYVPALLVVIITWNAWCTSRIQADISEST